MGEQKIEESKKQNKTNPDNWLNRLVLFGGVIALWCVSWLCIDRFVEQKDTGIFGDKFGAVNSLFSGLAFAGIIYTIILQRIELKEQRKELKLTRKEIKGQKKEFKTQNQTLKTQRFENTFFNLLSNHKELLNNFSIRIYPEINLKIAKDQGRPINLDAKVGRHYLRKYYNNLKSSLSKDEKKLADHVIKYELGESVFPEMTLYFNSIRTILQYISESTLVSSSEKPFYFDIVKSQLLYLEETIILYKLIYADESSDNLMLRKLVLQHSILTIVDMTPFHKSHYSDIRALVEEQHIFLNQEKELSKTF